MCPRTWCRSWLPVSAVLVVVLAVPARAVTMDFVRVGDAGNKATSGGWGAVNYDYAIGKYEVTIQQYADFLNAVAQSDPYGLWAFDMGDNRAIRGIARSGSSGSYTYTVMTPSGTTPAGANSPGNRPITLVSWFDAARFANWMHNGQGSGSTETGAYTLLDGQTSGTAPVKNANAIYWIPTEQEWFKAAYYSPLLASGSGGYYTYATQSNTAPGNTIGSGSNQANYYAGDYAVTQQTFAPNQNYLTNVGAFTASASYYGTFDQSGNVSEWSDGNGTGTNLSNFGGSYMNDATQVSQLGMVRPISSSNQSTILGFRLAAVPEPSTYAMALAGAACGGFSLWQRRKRA